MTGQQLKNSILQLAIQGKLVPQNPDDEPASELLKRIKSEKEKLVREKKIILSKPEKGVKPLTKSEFDIPNNWTTCRLVDICRAFGRIGFRGYTKQDLVSGPNFGAISISPSNMKEYGMDYSDCTYITWDKYEESPEIKISNGDILIVKTGSSYGKTVVVRDLPHEATINPQIAVIKDIRIYTEYLACFLKSPIAKAFYERFVLGTSIPTFSQLNLLSIEIPLPPLPEQHRIVAKIEELMPLVEEYDKAQVELNALNANLPEALKKSILQEAIQGKLGTNNPDDEPASELLKRIRAEKAKLIKEKAIKKEKPLPEISEDEIPFEIPENWVWCYMGDLFMHNNGKQLNKGNAHGTMMDYITTSNLYWDNFVLDKIKQMPFTDDEIERCQAIKGDLLICEGGDIGRAAIWNYDNPIMLQNHLHKCRAYLPLCTQYFKHIFYYYNKTGQIGGKGIGIQGFSSGALHKTLIPLPPLPEQHRIVEKLNNILPKLKNL